MAKFSAESIFADNHHMTNVACRDEQEAWENNQIWKQTDSLVPGAESCKLANLFMPGDVWTLLEQRRKRFFFRNSSIFMQMNSKRMDS